MKAEKRLMSKKIKREIIKGYEPIITQKQKGARKGGSDKKKVDGAFGNKKKKTTQKKKRKVTKRDGWG